MQFKVGDLVQSVSDHVEVRMVVRANKRLNLDEHESIGVARCDVYAGKPTNIEEMFSWSLPAYWEMYSDDDNLKRVIEQGVKECS